MPKKKQNLLGKEFRKLQPKLRVIANGSAQVNAIRAEQCGAVIAAIDDKKLLSHPAVAISDDACPVEADDLAESAKRGSLKELAPNILTNVFLQTTKTANNIKKLPDKSARKANLATATVTVAQLRELAENPNVLYIEVGSNVKAPTPEVSKKRVAEPPVNRWRFGSAEKHDHGKGVLVGIVDVQGFDFSHPDFLDADEKTRFIRIWDQGGANRPSPHRRNSTDYSEAFDYGSELTKENLNGAIANADGFGLPAYELESQSQMEASSHGTHVASIAAGNHGVCSQATIAGVVIALGTGDDDRRRAFYDSTRLAHAVDYLINLAEEIDAKAVVINISLGTNGHAHDGSSSLSRWIDSSMTVPGRCVCVAAGNAGQEVAQFEGDAGYVMGRIHTSGKVPARGLDSDIEWLVVGNGLSDISENELEIWYSSQDSFAVSVRPPGMEWIGPIEPRQFVENKQLADKSFVSIYNELYHPANGSNYISVYLSPFFHESGIVGVRAGQWTVRLHGREVRDGKFHGWIERDDPRRLGRVGEKKEAWMFPSFFTEKSMVDDSSVSSLACGHRVLSVANLDEAKDLINVTSSQGPTRDGRFKPDVAAPGTDIVAANGFGGAENQWVAMTGTSMACPFVAGVVGLMLAVEPKLTAAQIEGIVQSTARPLPGGNFSWLNTAGFGRLDADRCLQEAAAINNREDKT